MNNLDNYLLFFGGVFSNFHPCLFLVDKQVYNCNEQYFMKMKQELFDKDNFDLAHAIISEKDPKIIKKYGRLVQNYNEEVWNKKRYKIMVKGLYAKFSQNLDLKLELLNTQNKILVEASPFDNIWGIGIGVEKALKMDPSQWKGQNLLGKALMEVREMLKNK